MNISVVMKKKIIFEKICFKSNNKQTEFREIYFDDYILRYLVLMTLFSNQTCLRNYSITYANGMFMYWNTEATQQTISRIIFVFQLNNVNCRDILFCLPEEKTCLFKVCCHQLENSLLFRKTSSNVILTKIIPRPCSLYYNHAQTL